MRTVGVTGTNGKTTTTWLAAALLAETSPHVAMVTTLGSFLDGARIEVPAGFEGLVATMRACEAKGGNLAAIEYTSEALTRGVAKHWPADIAVFTNLSHDHQDAHPSFEHYLASKAQLFVALKDGGAAVLNACDENAALIDEVVPPGRAKIFYGLASRGNPWRALDLTASNVTFDWSGTDFTLAKSPRVANACKLHINAIGAIFAENALAAIGAGLAAGISLDAIAKRLATAPIPAGRFELVARDPHVVVDYAHSPDALARTLATARALATGKVTVVFGAGGNRDADKRPLLGEAAKVADRVIVTSDNPRDEDPDAIAGAIREGLGAHANAVTILDRAEAIESAIAHAKENDVVVIAGKGHENVQIHGSRAEAFSDRDVAIATCLRLTRGNSPRPPNG